MPFRRRRSGVHSIAAVADYDCWRAWRSRSIMMCDAQLQHFEFNFFDSHFFALRFAVVSQCPKFDSQTAMQNQINYSLALSIRRSVQQNTQSTSGRNWSAAERFGSTYFDENVCSADFQLLTSRVELSMLFTQVTNDKSSVLLVFLTH